MCPLANCKLMSHRLYDPTSAKQPVKVKVPRKKQPEQIPGDIGRDGVDGLPQIPVDDPLNSELRVLFHHFFNSVFDRLAGIFRGPLLAPGYKSRMLEVALTNRAYCMGIITQAQTDMAISRCTFAETRESLDLYTKLINIFRNQLAASTTQGPPNPLHIEVALLVLCVLLSYNVTRGRISELNMNWTAMRHLVNIRGGVHNLTVALAYVVHVDRVCATMLGTHPTYVSPSPRLHPFNRPPWATYSPGFVRLEASQGHLATGPVLEHCLNTCELLSLYDAVHRAPSSEDHASVPSPPSPEYLYYLRDRVDEQFAILYAEMLNQNTPSKCILMATRIVEYPVTWANYVPSLTMDLCAELCALLRSQDLFDFWSGALDVLSWIFFVLATSPWPFAGREWAVTCLQGIIGAKYGAAQWPKDWWKEELANVKNFAWFETKQSSSFRQACNELEAGTRRESLPENENGPKPKIEPDAEPAQEKGI
ncbi:hypothetical protein A1O3_02119 [Capronia epimyces CBS 606.96]|uniref:Transcription factor domain-containing protein n=1 Tax=Capronia epimyces CBS 606.96 TaxID=1182542 RepID=W9YHB7_9EURO|nr:uncharacterized protein A1O3_02119 [Capronia epimyces CBS 606.96]EXJ89055.1 hypothetical protein A1O3_02119 [Capronia epimyces CBS 606.96]